MAKEQNIQTQIQKLITKRYSGKPVNGQYSKAGIPDILACINGRFVAIEVKQPGESPRPLQTAQINEFITAGAIAFWSDSVQHTQSTLDQYFQQPDEI